MVTQKQEEKVYLVKYWLENVMPYQFPGFVDNNSNSAKIHEHIRRVFGGVYSLQNISATVGSLSSNLLGLGVASPEQDAARKKAEDDKRKAEEARKDAEAQAQVVQTWLTRYCPEGLKGPNGEPFPGDQDRIVAFVLKNYGGKCSIEALNNAVEVLGPVLTWFSSDPADREIRNRPAPPPRKLSEKAQREAGMLPERLKGHADDGKFVDPNEKLRTIVKKLTCDISDPNLVAADQISVVNRYGRVDHGFTAELRKIFAHNRDGSVNGKETLRLRKAAADQYELRRNRDGGQHG